MGSEMCIRDRSSIVVFEDSYKGLDAANTGGFISCGVGSAENLSNADFVIDGFEGFTIEELERRIGLIS